MGLLDRRTFVNSVAGAALAVGVAGEVQAADTAIPILDCHIHLFDQTRPQGAPYTGGGANREPALPARYRGLAAPLGVVGAIAIEASPWIEDNLWLLETEQPDRFMVGAIGNLRPEKPEFREYLERYHRNRLFLGIRYGNLWDYDLVHQVANPVFVEGIRLLDQASLALDTANPRRDLLGAVLRLTDRVPKLRVILDHLPSLLSRLEGNARAQVEADLRELAHRPLVFAKISEVMRMSGARPVMDPQAYRPVLDSLFGIFGEDRVLFGSDWPNADAVNHLPEIVGIMQQYFQAKGRRVAEKYFWRNSVAAYRWVRRSDSQPQAG